MQNATANRYLGASGAEKNDSADREPLHCRGRPRPGQGGAAHGVLCSAVVGCAPGK